MEVQALEKRFGYRKIIHQLNLQLHPGEGVLLLGPNGAGKTTLMRILSGLLRADSGKVIFWGTNVSKQEAAHRKKRGTLFHQTHLYDEMTAEENLSFFCSLYQLGVDKQQIRKILKEVELEKSGDLPVRFFSTGMRKRVGLARLLLQKPELLLLDEPYSGLDFKTVDFFNQFLTGFKQNGGMLLLASHQIEQSLPVTDRILELYQGAVRDITQKYQQDV